MEKDIKKINESGIKTALEPSNNIERFLDSNGRIVQLPHKQRLRRDLLEYLAAKFEIGRIYTEKQINDICNQWHTFEDYFVLRRELVDSGLLARKRDGSCYWRVEKSPHITQAAEISKETFKP